MKNIYINDEDQLKTTAAQSIFNLYRLYMEGEPYDHTHFLNIRTANCKSASSTLVAIWQSGYFMFVLI